MMRMVLPKSVEVEITTRVLFGPAKSSVLLSGSEVMQTETSNYLRTILGFGHDLKGEWQKLVTACQVGNCSPSL